ncbi:PAS domain S-box protein [Deinococcus deserti]|uniref:histidine kinase n=1 Tax=Deinococcus deserti (strain DSM 17065 / CIP 109153 / LMG 22923 / VCD115) TaxID=546414 RepID=C1CV89_DEIDV|nr:PAS domain S-box protein [Deinococcus deserti]ACO46106.2 putative histidine kinase, classic [Deinococcus deserti VCD115]
MSFLPTGRPADQARNAPTSLSQDLLELLDLINGIVWEADPETGRNTFVSAMVESLLGYTQSEWTTAPGFWEDRIHPDDRDRVLAETDRLIGIGAPYELDYRLQASDGRYVWIRDRITPRFDERGRMVKLGGVMMDITAQKKTEDQLRSAHDRLAKVFSASPVGIGLTGLQSGRVMDTNDALLEIIGCSREAFVGSGLEQVDPWVNPRDRDEIVQGLKEGGSVRDFESQLHHFPTGELRDVLLSAELLNLDSEDVLLIITQDMTERKKTEAALSASEARFKALVQHSSDMVSVVNRGGYMTYTSPSLIHILGYPADEMLRRQVMDFLHPDEFGEIQEAFAQTVFGGPGTTRTLTSRFQHRDGTYRWLEWVATNRLDDPHVRGIVMNSRDVSERKASEEALEESRRTFEVLFEHSPDAIMLIDFEGIMPIVHCNEVAAVMNGYTRDELIGQSVYITVPHGDTLMADPAADHQFRESVRAQGRLRMESTHRRKDGSLFPIEIHLALVNIGGRELMLSIERDISERKAAEEALRASQSRLLSSEKLASLGRLTAGLAHEVNTPLAATMNYLHEAARLAREYRDSVGVSEVTEDDHREIATELCGAIEEGAKTAARIGEFIRSMRGHTRDTVSGVQDFDAVKMASETLIMVAHEARSAGIDLLLEQPKSPVELRGEPGRFTQVLTNLVVNSVHACSDSGRPKGQVTVSFDTDNGRTVMRVSDTGTGIPAEILPRIFDPMFTTKDVGKGTGLGLSIIHDIVTGHFHGDIAVETEVGVGTTFVVTFPPLAAT